MTGAIPPLPLYVFMTWKGKHFFSLKAYRSVLGRAQASYYGGTAVCLFGVKRPGGVVHQLPSSVAEVRESMRHFLYGQLYRCNAAYIPVVRIVIRSICSVNIYIFAQFFQACYTPSFFAWNMQSI